MTSFHCQRVDALFHHRTGVKTLSFDTPLAVTQYFEIDVVFSQLTVEPGYYHMVEEDIVYHETSGSRPNYSFTWLSGSATCGGMLSNLAERAFITPQLINEDPQVVSTS